VEISTLKEEKHMQKLWKHSYKVKILILSKITNKNYKIHICLGWNIFYDYFEKW
jgi:hypothetical protein